MRQGVFNEVWVVFDDDNHPAKVEAFTQAKQIINDKYVNIAYSSIAFEYYLLLHFERINKAFDKSECREGKTPIWCSTGQHPDDCWGNKCVGGYARNKGYWSDSKEKKSLFPVVEDKLKTGFWNAAWLRRESDRFFPDVIFYRRNPYITADSIVKRLTGFQHDTFDVVQQGEGVEVSNNIVIKFQIDLSVKIANNRQTAFVLPPDCITREILGTNESEKIGERFIIEPSSAVIISFAPKPGDTRPSQYYLTYDNTHLMMSTDTDATP